MPGETVSGDAATAPARRPAGAGRDRRPGPRAVGRGRGALAAAAVEEHADEPPDALLAMVHKATRAAGGRRPRWPRIDVETGPPRLAGRGQRRRGGRAGGRHGPARGPRACSWPPACSAPSCRRCGRWPRSPCTTATPSCWPPTACGSTWPTPGGRPCGRRPWPGGSWPTTPRPPTTTRWSWCARLGLDRPAAGVGRGAVQPSRPRVTDYAAALAGYVERGREDELEAAFTLGRQAVAEGMTILGLVDQHRAAVDVLVRECAHLDPPGSRPRSSSCPRRWPPSRWPSGATGRPRRWRPRERRDRPHAPARAATVPCPTCAGLDVAVRYLPGEATSQAGGDWYDLFPLPDGRVGLVVGDVTGHGVAAAASMGQMRMAVLAYARRGSRPATWSERSTCWSRPWAGATWRPWSTPSPTWPPTSWSSPAPATRRPSWCRPDGPVASMRAREPLLGLDPALDRRVGETVAVPPGSHVLFYTDGLVEPLERREEDGVASLVEATYGFGAPPTTCASTCSPPSPPTSPATTSASSLSPSHPGALAGPPTPGPRGHPARVGTRRRVGVHSHHLA